MVWFGMPDPEQPSYEDLAARNAELTGRVEELLAVVAGAGRVDRVAILSSLIASADRD
jgi:hypothetical protein